MIGKSVEEMLSHYRNCGQLRSDLEYLSLEHSELNRALLSVVIASYTQFVIRTLKARDDVKG